MQQVSSLYTQIVSQLNHYFEVSVVIDGEVHNEDEIVSMETNISVLRDKFEVGGTPSQEIDLVLINPEKSFPRRASVEPFVRAVGYIDGSLVKSEWRPKGIFYSDTKEYSKTSSGITYCTIHGYDAMLLFEKTTSNWLAASPYTDLKIVRTIANFVGVTIDNRTYDILTGSFTLDATKLRDHSFREILSSIAAKHLGFFCITDEGMLLLQSMVDLPEDTGFLINEVGNNILFGNTRILV